MIRLPSRRVRRLVLGGGMVLALIGATWWAAHRASPQPVVPGATASPVDTGALSEETTSLPGESVAEAISTPPSRSRMPPVGVPLPDVRRQLERAAREGDARAACRIAIDTMRCLSVQAVTRALGGSVLSGPGGTAPSALALVRTIESQESIAASVSIEGVRLDGGTGTLSARKRLAPLAESCGPITPAEIDEALRFLRASALAGVRDAQRLYALGEPWWLTAPGAMAHPMFDAWLQEAPAVMGALLAAGDPLAPGMLASAYGGETWTSAAFPVDRQRAATYALLAERIAPPSRLPSTVSMYLAPLSAEARAAAREDADRLFRTLYGGRPRPDARSAPSAIVFAIVDTIGTFGTPHRNEGRPPCASVDSPPPRR